MVVAVAVAVAVAARDLEGGADPEPQARHQVRDQHQCSRQPEEAKVRRVERNFVLDAPQ
jgi:hypothetical protein